MIFGLALLLVGLLEVVLLTNFASDEVSFACRHKISLR